uniref:Uncharacterized protein n=1 Tax=Zooxanthella nutricula TaxID=1333877 RepID=A0A6U6S450_9DINO
MPSLPLAALVILGQLCSVQGAPGMERRLRGNAGAGAAEPRGAQAANASQAPTGAPASAGALASTGSSWTPVRIGWAGSQPGDYGFPDAGSGTGEATCLDVDASTYDWASPLVQVYRCNGKDGQLFLVEQDAESNLPQIKWAAKPSKCLDVVDGHQTPQQKRHEVKLHDCHPQGHPDRVNQAFSVQFMSSGYVSHILWLGNGKNQCLDNWDGAVSTHSAHLSQIATWTCHPYSEGAAGLNQMWYWAADPVAPTSTTAPPDCSGIFAPELCDSTPGCSWCGRPPEACFATATDACAN